MVGKSTERLLRREKVKVTWRTLPHPSPGCQVNLQPPSLAAGRGGRHGWGAQHGVGALRLQPRLPGEERAQDADSCPFLGLLGTNCPGDGKAPEVWQAVHPWAESLDCV